jgi:hypothetical protein
VASGPHNLRFLVHDPASVGPGAEVRAHLLGPDDLPLRGEVRFGPASGRGRRGQEVGEAPLTIRCGFADEEIAALVVPTAAGRAGTLLLQTCLLPPRERPYGLVVELARHRIKHFVQKCEEWQMWDPGLARGAMSRWDEAREMFAEALLAADPAQGERIARRSLERSIEASEHLAMAHAEILLHRRYGSRAASSTTLGTVLRTGTPIAKPFEEALAEIDVLSVPTPWRLLEPRRGKPDFAPLDRLVGWAAERRKPVMLGPLLDLRESQIPDHARVYRHDYESFRDMAYEHLDRLVHRYQVPGGPIGIWNVGSGFHANEWMELSVEQMIDLARRVTVLVRQRNRRANTLLELVGLFGERFSRTRGAILPLRYAELLQQQGLGISAMGLRAVLGGEGEASRDLFQMSCMLDRFLSRETRLMLSSFGVPARNVDADGGTWRDGWSPETQALWAGRMASIALSKPFVEAIIWCESSDAGPAALAGYGLFDGDGAARPIVAKLGAIRRRLRQPLGPRREAEDSGS